MDTLTQIYTEIYKPHFLLSTFFYFFLHTTSQHHNITSTQNKQNNRHILNILKVQSKKKKQNKSFLYIIKKHCKASIVEGLAPLILTVVHSQVTICRRLWIHYVFPHVWCKPVLYYCPLRSHKTNKQHSLLY